MTEKPPFKRGDVITCIDGSYKEDIEFAVVDCYRGSYSNQWMVRIRLPDGTSSSGRFAHRFRGKGGPW